ncbi:hypothetical protein DdX_01593 [Ditylenchus destructor]|uniref:Uncharacterized protein n=1 Tax=Ditylenchus destructor TaxID=166010 RepID=A0AAD4NH28_9BILA|nr:hypothetical protein DdX_01593 [Ditylenchus destructor]
MDLPKIGQTDKNMHWLFFHYTVSYHIKSAMTDVSTTELLAQISQTSPGNATKESGSKEAQEYYDYSAAPVSPQFYAPQQFSPSYYAQPGYPLIPSQLSRFTPDSSSYYPRERYSSTPPTRQFSLPYASYRPPLGSDLQSGVDASQKAILAKIGEESESFASRSRKADSKSDGPLERLLSKFATQLPRIAQSVMEIGVSGTGVGTTPVFSKVPDAREREIPPQPIGSMTLIEEASTDRDVFASTERSPYGTAAVVNSMPDPASIFSFGDLLSSFTKNSSNNNGKVEKEQEIEAETVYDMRTLRGTPILKSIDEEPETEPKFPNSKPNGPASHRSSSGGLMSWLNPLLQGLDAAGNSSTSAPQNPVQTKNDESETDPADNLLASLVAGKMPKIDWLKTILGPKSSGDSGNALAQLFGNGGGLKSLLGSGLDDQPIITSDRNIPGRWSRK